MNKCFFRLRNCGVVLLILFATASASAQGLGLISTNAFPSLVFSNPVCITTPPGEMNRLFVVEKHGRIVVITNLAAPTRTIFMDISGRITVFNSSESGDVGGEEGLLGLAFHPAYASNRNFYVFYTGPATNGTSGLHDILSCFQTSATNPNQGDTNSEVRFIVQYDQANNHNAGDLHFGPDGSLYVALGDEGGSYGQYGNSQHIDNDFFSAIMRIDVDKNAGNPAPNPHASALPSLTNYAIPFDNPWIGATNFNGATVNSNQVRTEFWAVGMRNPWRFSFDPLTGQMYLGHVGQATLEWVNLVGKGDNAGWNFFEGSKQWTNNLPTGFTHIPPLVEYGHTNGRSAIIGGVVYQGNRAPQLSGAYLYADEGSSEVWVLRHNGMTVTENTVIFKDTGALPSSFGIDPSNGDVLYTAIRSGNNSIIKRILSVIPSINSVALSEGNLVASGAGGLPGGSYYVLGSTNIASPPAGWTRLATNSFDALGNFTFTKAVAAGVSQLFLQLQTP
jgi:glucose/arabinose dehydrogenase